MYSKVYIILKETKRNTNYSVFFLFVYLQIQQTAKIAKSMCRNNIHVNISLSQPPIARFT